MNDAFKSFMDQIVMPVLTVNVTDCQPELRSLAFQLTQELAHGELEPVTSLSARIAQAACSGQFSRHPAILGLIVNLTDLLEREERGITSLKGRRKMSDQEREILHEASSLLLLNGASKEVLRSLGFNRKSLLRSEGSVANLLQNGLPSPALALMYSEIMAQNVSCIDSLVPRYEGESQRRFVCGFESWIVLACISMYFLIFNNFL